MKVNRICLVVDKSSSMNHLSNQVQKSLNDIVASHKINSEQYKILTFLSRVDFAENAQVVYKEQLVKNVGNQSYCAYGNTAIFDAVGLAVETIDDGSNDPDTSYRVDVITDGEENSSKRFNRYQIKKLIKDKEADGRWTFAFQVPPNKKLAFHQQFGIPLENITEWEATTKGMEETTYRNMRANDAFYSMKSASPLGQNFSVKNFYTVDANLANVKSTDVKKKLDDVSDKFDVYTVDKECEIRPFVESKTGKSYKIGSSFYQLSKPERVQASKDVLVMEKGKKAIWAGKEARSLIGLPTDGVSEAKLTPYNLSTYEIFVTSKSVNRKLVRGTKVLVNKFKNNDDIPTWNHNQV